MTHFPGGAFRRLSPPARVEAKEGDQPLAVLSSVITGASSERPHAKRVADRLAANARDPHFTSARKAG